MGAVEPRGCKGGRRGRLLRCRNTPCANGATKNPERDAEAACSFGKAKHRGIAHWRVVQFVRRPLTTASATRQGYAVSLWLRGASPGACRAPRPRTPPIGDAYGKYRLAWVSLIAGSPLRLSSLSHPRGKREDLTHDTEDRTVAAGTGGSFAIGQGGRKLVPAGRVALARDAASHRLLTRRRSSSTPAHQRSQKRRETWTELAARAPTSAR